MALHSLNDGIQLLRADSLTQLAGDLTYVKHSYHIRSAAHWRDLCKALDLLRLFGTTQFLAGFSQQFSFPSIVGFAVDAVGRAPFGYALTASSAGSYAFFPCGCIISLPDCYDC